MVTPTPGRCTATPTGHLSVGVGEGAGVRGGVGPRLGDGRGGGGAALPGGPGEVDGGFRRVGMTGGGGRTRRAVWLGLVVGVGAAV
jgi:hypothetical protein